MRVRAGAEYDSLKSLVVLKASTGEPVELLKLWEVCYTSAVTPGDGLYQDHCSARASPSKRSQRSCLPSDLLKQDDIKEHLEQQRFRMLLPARLLPP